MPLVVVTEDEKAELGEMVGETVVPAEMFPEAVTEEDTPHHRLGRLPVAGVELGPGSIQAMIRTLLISSLKLLSFD